MRRTTNHVVLNVNTLLWQLPFPPPFPPPPPPYPPLPISLAVWPVFARIDGNTTQVTAQATLMGSATVIGTTGTGSLGTLGPNSSISIPPAGQSVIQIRPIPVHPSIRPLLGNPNLPGIVGVVVVVLNRGGIEDDALVAGHTALNSAVEAALNNLIMTFGPSHTQITPEDINSLVNQVKTQVEHAVHQALGPLDKIHAWWSNGGPVGNVVVHFTQDDLPHLLHDLDDTDFTRTVADAGARGAISLGGSISLARAKDRPISLDRATMTSTLTGGIASLFTAPG